MNSVGILVADDHELFRRGVAAQLAQVPGWQVIAEAANGREAVELAARMKPDIAVVDLTMPDLNGLAATRQMLAVNEHLRVLVLTAHESEQLVREVVSAGALGYVLKSDAGRVLVAAVRSLIEGAPFFTSRVAKLVIDGYLRGEAEAGRLASVLSEREREIVQLLAEGMSNKEVARTLHISVKTAETHRSNIMRKIECGSLAELVRYAIRNKLIEP